MFNSDDLCEILLDLFIVSFFSFISVLLTFLVGYLITSFMFWDFYDPLEVFGGTLLRVISVFGFILFFGMYWKI